MGYWETVRKVVDEADIIFEVLDARFPGQCRNSDLEALVRRGNKRLVFIINKSDLVGKKAAMRIKAELGDSVFISAKLRKGTAVLRRVLGEMTGQILAEKTRRMEMRRDFVRGEKSNQHHGFSKEQKNTPEQNAQWQKNNDHQLSPGQKKSEDYWRGVQKRQMQQQKEMQKNNEMRQESREKNHGWQPVQKNNGQGGPLQNSQGQGSQNLACQKNNQIPDSHAPQGHVEVNAQGQNEFGNADSENETNEANGIFPRIVKGSVKIAFCGYPNVGKSSIINALSRRRSARTSPRAGFTKGLQHVRVNRKVLLIDTPGVIPVRENDELMMALLASKNPENLRDLEGTGIDMAEMLLRNDPETLGEFYGVTSNDGEEFLEKLAVSRNRLLRGGKPDIKLAAKILISDFQNGKIKMTVESREKLFRGINPGEARKKDNRSQ